MIHSHDSCLFTVDHRILIGCATQFLRASRASNRDITAINQNIFTDMKLTYYVVMYVYARWSNCVQAALPIGPFIE